MKLFIQTLFLFSTILYIFQNIVHADGVAYDRSSMRPLVQNEQMAAIFHHDGIQAMIIAINFDIDDEDDALWIFPVPGTPSKVDLDVIDSFPRFRGRSTYQLAMDNLFKFVSISFATQLYPIVLADLFVVHRGGTGDISIHEQFEKHGVHVEAITAKSIDGLADYLPGLPKEELQVFGPYLDDKHVLVVARIISRKQILEEFPDYVSHSVRNLERWPCLYAKFPTDKPFYPLRPTNRYGNVAIKLRLFVVGHVKIDSGSYLKGYQFQPKHYRQLPPYHESLRRFTEDLSARYLQYTVWDDYVLAEEITDDLWFTPIQHLGRKSYNNLIIALSHSKISILLAIIYIAFLSYISAGLSGLILFREWKKFARIGLWNLLSIIGLIARVSFIDKTVRFSLLFTFIYFLLNVISFMLITIPVGG